VPQIYINLAGGWKKQLMETDNFLTLPKHLEGQTNTHGDFEEF